MDKKSRFGGKKKEKLIDSFDLNCWKIFDISLFSRGMSEVLKIVEGWIESEAKSKWIATINPEFIMKAVKNDEFRALLKKTDLNVMDGVGLLWAREVGNGKNWLKAGFEVMMGKYREGLVTGADLMPELCKLASKKAYKVFFLGGFEDRAKRTAMYFSDNCQMTNDKIGWCAGEPDIKNEEVIEQINRFRPDILFVAYGMKRQEEWIKNNRDKADFGVAIGVGRSFDYYSGDLKRAPEIWRKMGMEWLYSLIKEPKRIKRQLELPKFMWKVLTD
jgi:N-acetylglucosaminyldiphosphoundecaprenol N-acetyl-beta-D-mannosaminyltransferase